MASSNYYLSFSNTYRLCLRPFFFPLALCHYIRFLQRLCAGNCNEYSFVTFTYSLNLNQYAICFNMILNLLHSYLSTHFGHDSGTGDWFCWQGHN
uniref:Nicastrin-related n=1 Tax=Arundo donax TaxID=35708 RepID=A0A0A8ZZU8_ARUDO